MGPRKVKPPYVVNIVNVVNVDPEVCGFGPLRERITDALATSLGDEAYIRCDQLWPDGRRPKLMDKS